MKNKWIWIGIIIVVIIGVGGKLYMNKTAKEKQQEELHDIQVDLANYLFNNYQLYTKDNEKVNEVIKEYDNGKEASTEQYVNDLKSARIYSPIKQIEFTEFTVSQMNTLNAHLIINGVYEEEVSLGTMSAETNKFLYKITNGTGHGPYYIFEKEVKTNTSMPVKDIIFYGGAINK